MKLQRTYDTRTQLTELFQNARQAGAKQIVVRTANSDDGTIVEIADDGRGVPDHVALTTYGKSAWPEGPQGNRGAGLQTLDERGYTVRTNTEADPAKGWMLTVPPNRTTNRPPAKEAPDAKTPTTPGTVITFTTLATRNSVREAVEAAARHLPVTVILDGDKPSPIKKVHFLEGTAHRREYDGAMFGVYPNQTPSPPDINLHGRTLDGQLPVVETRTGVWSVKADITLVRPGLYAAEIWPLELRATPELERLRTNAERAIYETMAGLGTNAGINTPTLKRARTLGVELPEQYPMLRIWRSTRGPGEHAPNLKNPLPVPADGFIIKIDESEANTPIVIGAMLERALAVNTLSDSAFRPEAECEGQNWYDALPVAVKATWFVRKNETKPWFETSSPEGGDLTSSASTRTEIEVRLYDQDGKVIRKLATDVMFWYDVDMADGREADDLGIYVSPTTDLTVQTLAKLLIDTMFWFNVESDIDERRLKEFEIDAGYRATEILEDETTADLRRIALIAENELRWRVQDAGSIEILMAPNGVTVTRRPSGVDNDTTDKDTLTFTRAELKVGENAD